MSEHGAIHDKAARLMHYFWHNKQNGRPKIGASAKRALDRIEIKIPRELQANCQRRRMTRSMDFGADFVHQMKTVKYDRQSIFEGASCD